MHNCYEELQWGGAHTWSQWQEESNQVTTWHRVFQGVEIANIKTLSLKHFGFQSFWWELSSSLIEDPLKVMSHFTLGAFKVLSLALGSLIIMCVGVGLFEQSYLKFVELLRSNLGSSESLFLQIFSLPLPLSPPSGTPSINMSLHPTVPQDG